MGRHHTVKVPEGTSHPGKQRAFHAFRPQFNDDPPRYMPGGVAMEDWDVVPFSDLESLLVFGRKDSDGPSIEF